MSHADGTRQMSDGGFSTFWLDLREPSDHAARDQKLLRMAADCAGNGRVILDLGSGTGSTARAFEGVAPDLYWRFLDGDPILLDVAANRHPSSEQVVADLADVDALLLDGVGLVTASALLDLMPADWIEKLARRLKSANVPFYAALNYNGQMSWMPALSEDDPVTASFNKHQLTDKGIGPAVGPASADTTMQLFESAGFDVYSADSPWVLDSRQAPFQHELLAGVAHAAEEVGSLAAPYWLEERNKAVDHSTMTVGHTDIFAVPR